MNASEWIGRSSRLMSDFPSHSIAFALRSSSHSSIQTSFVVRLFEIALEWSVNYCRMIFETDTSPRFKGVLQTRFINRRNISKFDLIPDQMTECFSITYLHPFSLSSFGTIRILFESALWSFSSSLAISVGVGSRVWKNSEDYFIFVSVFDTLLASNHRCCFHDSWPSTFHY